MKIRGILLTFCGLLTFASQVFGENVVEEVVVTGSYIARDIEEQQIPVDVIGRDEFLAAGSPQIIDILDNLPSLAGGLNRSEQYIAGGVADWYQEREHSRPWPRPYARVAKRQANH
jgi:hypothetical protein